MSLQASHTAENYLPTLQLYEDFSATHSILCQQGEMPQLYMSKSDLRSTSVYVKEVNKACCGSSGTCTYLSVRLFGSAAIIRIYLGTIKSLTMLQESNAKSVEYLSLFN